MHRTFFVFLKCTIQGWPKVDVLLIAFLHLWLKFCKGIDKYWIFPVRKLFCYHHCIKVIYFSMLQEQMNTGDSQTILELLLKTPKRTTTEKKSKFSEKLLKDQKMLKKYPKKRSFQVSPKALYKPLKNFKKYSFKCNLNISQNPPQKLNKQQLNTILISFKYFWKKTLFCSLERIHREFKNNL